MQEIEHLRDKRLLIERIGIPRMAVLIARRLQEADGREVAGRYRIKKIMNVVLMVGRIYGLAIGLVRVANGRNRTRTCVRQILRRFVELERLVVGM